MKNRGFRAFSALLCIIMTTVLISFSVNARGYVDVDKKASLTLDYVCQDAGFSIYKVGDIDKFGKLSLSGDFASYPIVLDNDQDGWSELATTLKGFVASDGITAVQAGKIGSDNKLKFSDLSVGLYLVLGENSVKTENNIKTVYTPSPFLICLPNIVDENSEWIYDVSARPKYEMNEQEIVDIEAEKLWDDKGNEEARPASVEVQLMCGDKVYDTQTLNEANGWKYTWKELDSKEDWSIVEKNVSSDYTVKISKNGNKYTIINTAVNKTTTTTVNTTEDNSKPNNTANTDNTAPNITVPDDEPEPKLPQTGLLWWPVGLLAAAGLALILAGVIRKTRASNK